MVKTKSQLHRAFRKYGLETHKLSKILKKSSVDELISKYQEGRSKASLAREYGVTDWTVGNILKAHRIPTMHYNERRSAAGNGNNYTYFDNYSNEGCAYFYGLLLADGNLHKGTLQIGLHRQDRYILETLKQELNLSTVNVNDHDLLVRRTGNVSQVSSLRVMDLRIVESLRRLGFSERKSGKEKLPEVFKFNSHFWRGMVDGDGTIGVQGQRVTVGLVGSKELCEGFLNFAKTFSPNIKTKVRKVAGTVVYTVRITKKSTCIAILTAMYSGSTFHLTRKHERFKRALDI